jgi:hypothetical protein
MQNRSCMTVLSCLRRVWSTSITNSLILCDSAGLFCEEFGQRASPTHLPCKAGTSSPMHLSYFAVPKCLWLGTLCSASTISSIVPTYSTSNACTAAGTEIGLASIAPLQGQGLLIKPYLASSTSLFCPVSAVPTQQALFGKHYQLVLPCESHHLLHFCCMPCPLD